MYSRIAVDGARSLAQNRFGDPTLREIGLLLPPGYDDATSRRYPLVICLSGFAATGPSMAETEHAFEPPLHRRLFDAMARGEVAPALVAFPDCATRYGGSQFINSVNAGDMQDFLLEDMVDYLDRHYRTIAEPAGRSVIGRSSGGYGAIRALIDRPDRVGAAGALAPDCLFEHCYLPFFPSILDYWEHAGGYHQFVARPDHVTLKDHRFMLGMSLIGMASVYAPCPVPDRYGALFALPYDPETGDFDPEIWARWKAHDIDRLVDAADPAALRAMAPLLIRAGTHDEYNMHLSARYLCRKLDDTALAYRFETFDGYHGGNALVLIEMIGALLDHAMPARRSVAV